jgi:hypothetical protein
VSDTAISPDNIISKLCFLRYGGSFDDHSEALRHELHKALNSSQTAFLSRQAVNYWFKRDNGRSGVPARSDAMRFLDFYLATNISRHQLDNEQKKVYDQVSAYLRHYTDGSPKPLLSLSHSKRLLLDAPQSAVDLGRLADCIAGCFFVYHIRLVESPTVPLACEFLQIFRRSRELRFILWNQNERNQSDEFHGSVTLFGHTIWLIGTTPNGRRVRAMLFRDIQQWENERYNAVRLGILCSDIPRPSSPDPAACRVLIWKCPRTFTTTPSAAVYARRNVKNFTVEECEAEPLKSIFHLVDNESPANPETSSRERRDLILKVNQQTIERFCEITDNFSAEFHTTPEPLLSAG